MNRRIHPGAADSPKARADARLGRTVAVLIVAVSMLGAVVSWRVSVWSGIASGLDRQATQELLVAEQARTADHGQVAEDLRLFGRFDLERVLAAREGRHPALRADARDRAATASAVSRMLTASVPVPRGARIVYEVDATLQRLAANEPDLARADPRYLAGLAADAHDKVVRLVLIATLLLAALFFLTLAEISGFALRRWFAGGGVALTVAATAWFLLQSSPLPAV